MDRTKGTSEITHDQLIASRDAVHVMKVQVDSERIPEVVLTAIAFDIDVRVGVMSFPLKSILMQHAMYWMR